MPDRMITQQTPKLRKNIKMLQRHFIKDIEILTIPGSTVSGNRAGLVSALCRGKTGAIAIAAIPSQKRMNILKITNILQIRDGDY